MTPINALAKLISANPSAVKSIIKLANIEVLDSLGSNRYNIALQDKTLLAQSDKPLDTTQKYWAQLNLGKENKTTIANLVKIPKLFEDLKNNQFSLRVEDIQRVLQSPKPTTALAQQLLETLANTSSKEEFNNLSTLLLSLHSQTLTLPILYRDYFALLQLKKRYNKKSKKQFIDFYAAFEFLGPISGLITLDESEISVELLVAFSQTKQFLEQDMNNFSYKITIEIDREITPLFETNSNSLLDISI